MDGVFDVLGLDNDVREAASAIDGGFHLRIPAALACAFHR
jgi:hypothetical protein